MTSISTLLQVSYSLEPKDHWMLLAKVPPGFCFAHLSPLYTLNHIIPFPVLALTYRILTTFQDSTLLLPYREKISLSTQILLLSKLNSLYEKLLNTLHIAYTVVIISILEKRIMLLIL